MIRKLATVTALALLLTACGGTTKDSGAKQNGPSGSTDAANAQA